MENVLKIAAVYFLGQENIVTWQGKRQEDEYDTNNVYTCMKCKMIPVEIVLGMGGDEGEQRRG
jgi:hypothetical protein